MITLQTRLVVLIFVVVAAFIISFTCVNHMDLLRLSWRQQNDTQSCNSDILSQSKTTAVHRKTMMVDEQQKFRALTMNTTQHNQSGIVSKSNFHICETLQTRSNFTESSGGRLVATAEASDCSRSTKDPILLLLELAQEKNPGFHLRYLQDCPHKCCVTMDWDFIDTADLVAIVTSDLHLRSGNNKSV